jgi:hypothetical protein
MKAHTIRTRGEITDLSLFPNLLYLGPQRTGSTWLHANLSRHPEVHLHRDKETFYFSTLGCPETSRYRYDFLEDYLASYHEPLGRKLLKHYHALRRCGIPYSPKIRGDFTASYCVLEEAVMAQIVRFQPGMRGIVLLRDPVERAWSHAKKDLVRCRTQAPSREELFDFIGSAEQLVRADYGGIIRRWRRHLAPGHLFVAPYDMIATDPEALLDHISSFLGIRCFGGASKRHVTSRQNVTSSEPVPEWLQTAMIKELDEAKDSFRLLLDGIGSCRVY